MIIKGKIKANPPIIGSKFLGRHVMFYDGQTGAYFETMPPLDKGMLKVQKALLKKCHAN